MGFRTVVMLNNDYCHEWSKDLELGQKISHDMNMSRREAGFLDRYSSKVVECVHADTFTLATLGGYQQFNTLAHSGYRNTGVGLHEEVNEAALIMLKRAADDLGYRLVKKADKNAG